MRFFIALLALILFSCQTKRDSNPNKDSATQVQGVMDGDYEFYAGAVDGGYLYYKLSLTQKGSDLTGSIFTGIYLSKNDQGFYTMPAATMTSSITGQLGNANEFTLYLGTSTDTSRMDKNYKFPEPDKIFDADANGDPVVGVHRAGSDLQWIHNGDTLAFTKVVGPKSQ